MMRRYHRWLSVLFGLLILWIAATGAIVQFSRMTAPERPKAEAAAKSAPADPDDEGGRAPAATAPRPAPDATRQFIHFVTELHSGEEFGIAGQVISLVSGLALIFFALSGLWMYLDLYRGRMVRVRGGKRPRGGRFFWK